jgi:hypothetical protein
LRAQLASERGSIIPGASALTAAELRVLPMLATHLSFPEIGAEMFLSPHRWLRRYRQDGIAGLQDRSHRVWRASTSLVLAARCGASPACPGLVDRRGDSIQPRRPAR